MQCVLRTTAGIPCPLCGMSSLASRVLRGDLLGAIRADTIGIALVVVVAAVVGLHLLRLAGRTAPQLTSRVALVGGVSMLMLHWLVVLTGMVTLAPLR